jgi:hypothetical protein
MENETAEMGVAEGLPELGTKSSLPAMRKNPPLFLINTT